MNHGHEESFFPYTLILCMEVLEVNSWGYPLNLLAKVNSHAYVGLYFEFTLKLFIKCFKEFWWMSDQEGMSMWRDNSCFFTKNGWFKAYVPCPPWNDYRHSRTSSCINIVWFFLVFKFGIMMRRSRGWAIKPTTSLSCKL